MWLNKHHDELRVPTFTTAASFPKREADSAQGKQEEQRLEKWGFSWKTWEACLGCAAATCSSPLGNLRPKGRRAALGSPRELLAEPPAPHLPIFQTTSTRLPSPGESEKDPPRILTYRHNPFPSWGPGLSTVTSSFTRSTHLTFLFSFFANSNS